MIVPYTELPDEVGGWPRPLLDVAVADMDDVVVPCLVDSGALHTLLPQWVAEVSGTSLEAAADARDLDVAAMATRAIFVPIRLTAAGFTWQAEVGFCDPWPYGWGLLGQLSFFRFFTVAFRAADFTFEVESVDQ